MGGGHIGALLGKWMFTALPVEATSLAASVTATVLVMPTAAAYLLRDSCAPI